MSNIGNVATEAFGNMSTAGKVATIAGLAFGMPCIGVVVDIGVKTFQGMTAGKSFGTAVADAFGSSLAGKAVSAISSIGTSVTESPAGTAVGAVAGGVKSFGTAVAESPIGKAVGAVVDGVKSFGQSVANIGNTVQGWGQSLTEWGEKKEGRVWLAGSRICR